MTHFDNVDGTNRLNDATHRAIKNALDDAYAMQRKNWGAVVRYEPAECVYAVIRLGYQAADLDPRAIVRQTKDAIETFPHLAATQRQALIETLEKGIPKST